MQVTLPIRAVNTSNSREHWAVIAKRARSHRSAASNMTLMEIFREHPVWSYRDNGALISPVVVTLVRVAKRRLDDDGNVTSLKSVRDGVADALGLKDDSDPRVTWVYDQALGKEYEVRISILSRAEIDE